jgi:serine protease
MASGSPAAPLTGRLLVSLRAPVHGQAHAAAVEAVLARTQAQLDGPSVPEIGLLTVKAPVGVSQATFLRHLRAEPGVRRVTPERMFSFRSVSGEAVPANAPDDPAWSAIDGSPGTPPGTPIEWWATREGLPQAWSVARGEGSKVAVIDSGIDASHPDLASQIDYTNDLDGDPGAGPATVDQIGHGTHVAGLACAAANNGIGMAGAGYDCHLLIEKSDLTEASVIQAIIDATNHGAESINMSFGTDGHTPAPAQLHEAVSYAYRHNVILVAAAADQPVTEQGDPANVLQPAGTGSDMSDGFGLSVTSANFESQRSAFAGYGSEISMAAYGSFRDYSSEGGPPGIFSTFPANVTSIEQGTINPQVPACAYCRTSLGGDDRYAYLSGTSMAAPQVAAVAAMIRQLTPTLNAAQVIEILKQSATRPPGAGWSANLGWGILNAAAAVSLAQNVAAHPTSTVSRSVTARRKARAKARRRRRGGRVKHHPAHRTKHSRR